ncbi:MAG: type III-A CRISPR-associated RAMP protein Csm3 [Candidatus Poribacteria bacterium]|nr:type III-A CRISPR-associated RAMP protein Csm3 [Candidatus Poribacteria bacterium]
MSLQNGNAIRFLHGHIIISGILSCQSGIFIGGAEDTLQIGGVDKSVIRNPLTGEPYIPGSSLKGKLRSITERIVTAAHNQPLRANRPGGDRERKVWRHECDDFGDAKTCQLCRVFGATGSVATNDNYPGALLVRDSTLFNKDDLLQDGLPIIETKMENAIDRLTSAAHPRTFERVPAGAQFAFELIYRIETLETATKNPNPTIDSQRVKVDITNLLNAMEILEKDGLGGNISRGYGSIEFVVEKFQSYDINNNPMSCGFKTGNGQSLSACKGLIPSLI